MSNFPVREVKNLNGIAVFLDFRWSLSAIGLQAFHKNFPWSIVPSFLLTV